MKTYEYETDYTNTDDITDETTLDEGYDMTVVKNLLQELQTQFKSVTAIRPTHPVVENLLLITGHNSWADFQRQFREELQEYFGTTIETTEPVVDRSMLVRAEKRRDQIKEKIKETETSCKAFQAQIKQIEARLSQAELDALATEGMEWDPETHKKHQTAEKTALQCKAQLKTLEAKNPETQLKSLYLNLRHADGMVKFAEQAITGNFRVLVNTGRPKEDARLYQKLGESCVWEINRLMDREEQIEQQMVSERYSGAELGVARMTSFSFEDTTSGIYDRPIDRLHAVRDDLTETFATYSACQAGYELAAQAFTPSYDTEWFPQWEELPVALKKARQRLQTATINKARQQLEGARQLLKR